MINNMEHFVSLYGDNDTPSKFIRSGNFYEENIFLKFKDNIPDSGTFLDIGANIGNHSVMFNQYFPERPIISFEANPFNYAMLSINTSKIKNITAICCCLGESSAISRFVHFHPSPGCSRLPQYFGDEANGADTMFQTRLEDCLMLNLITQPLDNFDISDISFIKIDVECHELEVFKGSMNILQKYKPTIWIEDCTFKNGKDNSATKFLIDKLNYSIVDQDIDCNYLLKCSE